jgi:hypothetical protein
MPEAPMPARRNAKVDTRTRIVRMIRVQETVRPAADLGHASRAPAAA